MRGWVWWVSLFCAESCVCNYLSIQNIFASLGPAKLCKMASGGECRRRLKGENGEVDWMDNCWTIPGGPEISEESAHHPLNICQIKDNHSGSLPCCHHWSYRPQARTSCCCYGTRKRRVNGLWPRSKYAIMKRQWNDGFWILVIAIKHSSLLVFVALSRMQFVLSVRVRACACAVSVGSW